MFAGAFVFDTNAVISAALITKDMLVLHPFRGIPVVTPRDFVDDVGKSSRDAPRCRVRAYGWPADLSDDEILERLLALNLEQAGEAA